MKDKIFELIRNLQKEAEQFNNDFGKLNEDIEDFSNTILYYCSEITEVLDDE